MNQIIEVIHLSKVFGENTAVSDVSFSVKEGICFGLVGPNGAGKSTTMEIVEDIIAPSSGEILYRGKPRSGSFREEIGIQFQHTSLLNFLSVAGTGVVGRSYGGYMTLTLAGRHPELWAAAVDMFGPFDLVTFLERIPPTWKPYFHVALGDPENEKDLAFLNDRSPKTYIDDLACPMLVIQGRNDPRVVAEESEDLVNHLKSIGKDVELLLFENEGHGVEKYENKVICYNAITSFFIKMLM